MTLLTTDQFVVQRSLSGASRPTTYQAIRLDPSMASGFAAWFESRTWTNTGQTPATYNIGEPLPDGIPQNSYWIYDFGEVGCLWGFEKISNITTTGFGSQEFWLSDDGQTFEPFSPPNVANPDGVDGGNDKFQNVRIPKRYLKFKPAEQTEGKHVYGKSWSDNALIQPNSYKCVEYSFATQTEFLALDWTGSSDWVWVGEGPDTEGQPVSRQAAVYDLGAPNCLWGYDVFEDRPGLNSLDLVIYVSADGVTWRQQYVSDDSYQWLIEERYMKAGDWQAMATGSNSNFVPWYAFPRFYNTVPVDNALYSLQTQNLMANLEDTDLMVVCRSGTPYKATGAEIKDSLGSGGIFPSENDITISPSVPGTGTQADPFILATRIAAPAGSTVVTSETITFTDQPPSTNVVWTDNSTGVGTRFSQPVTQTDANGDWSGQLQYADSPDSAADTDYVGDLQIGILYFRWQVDQKLDDRIPTDVVSVNLVDTGSETGPRFTDQTFAFTSVVTDGAPLPTKTIEAHVDGSLRITPETSEIVGVTSTPVSNAPYLGGSATLAGSGTYINGLDNWNEIFTGSILNSPKVWMTNPAGNVIATYTFSAPAGVTSLQFAAYVTTGTCELIPITENGTDGEVTFDSNYIERSTDITKGRLTGFQIQQKGGADANVEIRWMGFNNQAWGSSLTDLTLADNKDLSVFQPGDLVQQNEGVTAPVPVFSTTLWTGNGVSNRNITSGIDNTVKSLVWVKSRTTTQYHNLADTVRGTGIGGLLFSNLNAAAGDATDRVNEFTSTGYKVGVDQSVNSSNGSTYVGWNFRAAPKFFDIQTYVGTKDVASVQVVPHNLQSKPGCMIVKCIDSSENWPVYHQSLTATESIYLNKTAAAQPYAALWDDTEPTDTEFTVGSEGMVNNQDKNYVAYLFADTPGLIKCGSYAGNGSTTGPVVDCGFEPQWLLIKNTTATNEWLLYDSAQNPSNPRDTVLYLDKEDAARQSDNFKINFLSNGFQPIMGSGTINAGNNNYIYVAIAEDAQADASVIPAGLFQSTTGNTITLTPQTDGWSANTGKFAKGPEQIVENARLYLKFDSNGAVSDLQSIPQDPPYTTTTTNPSLNLTFPSTFPSGETPDDELPDGTTLSVGIASENATNRSPVSGYEEAIPA